MDNNSESKLLYDPATYSDALFYEDGTYKSWMLSLCLKSLAKGSSSADSSPPSTSASSRLVSLGAGTGDFSLLLGGCLGIDAEFITCVEPQLEFCDEIRRRVDEIAELPSDEDSSFTCGLKEDGDGKGEGDGETEDVWSPLANLKKKAR